MFERIRFMLAALLVVLMMAGLTVGFSPVASADDGDPSAVTVQPEGLNIRVSWSSTAAADVVGYQIKTDPESPELTVGPDVSSAVLTGIRPNTSYQVSVAAVRAGGAGAAATSDTSAQVAAPGGSFTALSPARLLDTRDGTGAPLGSTTAVSLQVTGQQGVPDTSVSAVAMNVTVTEPFSAGYVTAYPSGVDRPEASNLNYVKGQTVANLVIVPVGPDGKVNLFSSARTHLVADIAGYFSTADAASPSAGLFEPVQPARLMDTRSGIGASTPGPGQQVKIKVVGVGGVPADNVSAVVLNTTVVGSSAPAGGWVTAYPTGGDIPLASTINFAKGQTVANRTIVPVGDDGTVAFFNSGGNTPIIVDVTGWFTAAEDGSASGSYFVPVNPTRLVDTRSGIGAPQAKLGKKSVLAVAVAGGHGLPAAQSSTPAGAPVITVTFVHPTLSTYGTVFPSLSIQPPASDLNATPGIDVPNLALPGLGVDGSVAVYNDDGTTDVVVDLSGYFVGNIHVPTTSVTIRPGQISGVAGDPASAAAVTLNQDVPRRQVGDIISAGVTPQTPNGLLVRITGISEGPQGQQILQTEPATLQEALGSADLAVSIPFNAADAIPVGAANQPTRVLTAQDLAGRQAARAHPAVTDSKKKSPCAGDNTSYVETSFGIVPSLNIEGHIGWHGFHPAIKVKAYAQVTENAYAGFAFGGKVSCSWDKILAEYNFPTVVFSVAGWPVVIVPHLTVTLKAAISGQAEISSSVTQQFVAKAGLDYDGSKVKPINEITNSVSYQPLALTQANGSASVAIEAEVIGKFYGIAGPTVTVTATLDADLDLLATPWWVLTFALTAKAGLHLEISVFDLGLDTPEFTLYRKVLAQAGGVPTGNEAVDLTFDEYDLGTSITDAYQSFGILFSGDSTPFLTSDGSNPTSPVLTGGGPNSFGDPLYGEFVNPDGSPRSVSSMVLDVGYIDDPGSTEVLAYSSTGVLLATVRANLVGIDRITINKADIHSFVVRSTGIEGSGWAIDNLQFLGFHGQVGVAAAARHQQETLPGGGSTRVDR